MKRLIGIERLRSIIVGMSFGWCCGCQPEGASVEEAGDDAVWSECFDKQEHSSCQEACDAEGKTCVENGCPADPRYCVPDGCEAATVVVALNENICADTEVGGYLAQSCADPIGWQANSIGRCCCAS